jgi:hypothetical protein
MELEQEEELVTTPEMVLEAAPDTPSGASPKNEGRTMPILFRNKVYLINKYAGTLWQVYDYYVGLHIDDITSSSRYNAIIFTVDTSEQSITKYSECTDKAFTYDTFMSEYIELAPEDVPATIVKCLTNIQNSKVAKEIPYKKIIEHEARHLELLRTKINKYIYTFIQRIQDTLQQAKTITDYIYHPFTIYESDFTSHCKVYYKYPNADGVKRATFKEYIWYLFQKLYPLPDAEIEVIDMIQWIQMKMHERLVKEYPFMTIRYIGAPEYIQVVMPQSVLG